MISNLMVPATPKVRKPHRKHRTMNKSAATAVARVIHSFNNSWTTEIWQLPVSKDWCVWATNSKGRLYILSSVQELEEWFKVHDNWMAIYDEPSPPQQAV